VSTYVEFHSAHNLVITRLHVTSLQDYKVGTSHYGHHVVTCPNVTMVDCGREQKQMNRRMEAF